MLVRLAVAFFLAPLAVSAGELRLLMVEQPGCAYCARWEEEIGPKYALTAEGQAAPITRVQLRAPLPEGLTTASPASFTPTFILLDDGTETGRIEGYPGEDFFWPMLSALIAQAQSPGAEEIGE
ncbi:hypothetical protein SAMN05877809_102617 [Rhodobacter sp. JA431]|uniref:SoxS n=1 Tax=Rhodobacter sp. JA431 TaxID=570013 RepID=UPI000BD109EC|nr:SoxS [Rhodobacter sp. JA431]SOC00443.1 hypothetical protein SAMN05877809_102617 [Rhodobacter sp. JA431]